ncbi:MAG: 16S rRNA (cytosine(1402)-N(4))-methyltransferase, partial [Treponema sp.]|nr:16S rRNA (cytosine(1402)-N(4))-methyltransferase [Treponema sp.]
LYQNADERHSRRIARAIARARGSVAIATSAALAELVVRAMPAASRRGPIHPATRTMLALRIAVNEELIGLPNLLEGALRVIKPGGRLGFISFTSKEDGFVKRFFKEKSLACSCPPGMSFCGCGGQSVRLITRKGVTADEEEKRRNPPSRSARLRVAEKIKDVE